MLTGTRRGARRRRLAALIVTLAVMPWLAVATAAGAPESHTQINTTQGKRGTIVERVDKVYGSDATGRARSSGSPGTSGKSAEQRAGQQTSLMTAPRPMTEERFYYFVNRIPECFERVDRTPECTWKPPPDGPTNTPNRPAPPPSAAMVREIAREVILQLEIPAPEISIGPDPSINEWNMAAVGFPLWLWTDTPAALTTAHTAYGFTFDLSATRRHTTFSMGDGNTIRCQAMSPYTNTLKPGTPSPNCGYAYQQPSLPKGAYPQTPNGTYRVTATADWQVTWTAAGHQGTLPINVTAERDLPVGELFALLVTP